MIEMRKLNGGEPPFSALQLYQQQQQLKRCPTDLGLFSSFTCSKNNSTIFKSTSKHYDETYLISQLASNLSSSSSSLSPSSSSSSSSCSSCKYSTKANLISESNRPSNYSTTEPYSNESLLLLLSVSTSIEPSVADKEPLYANLAIANPTTKPRIVKMINDEQNERFFESNTLYKKELKQKQRDILSTSSSSLSLGLNKPGSPLLGLTKPTLDTLHEAK